MGSLFFLVGFMAMLGFAGLGYELILNHTFVGKLIDSWYDRLNK